MPRHEVCRVSPDVGSDEVCRVSLDVGSDEVCRVSPDVGSELFFMTKIACTVDMFGRHSWLDLSLRVRIFGSLADS